MIAAKFHENWSFQDIYLSKNPTLTKTRAQYLSQNILQIVNTSLTWANLI